VAAVWLDEYIKYFHATLPGSEYIYTGDLTERKGTCCSFPRNVILFLHEVDVKAEILEFSSAWFLLERKYNNGGDTEQDQRIRTTYLLETLPPGGNILTRPLKNYFSTDIFRLGKRCLSVEARSNTFPSL
jgi:hypothetical protein